jgi:hypothetical protein
VIVSFRRRRGVFSGSDRAAKANIYRRYLRLDVFPDPRHTDTSGEMAEEVRRTSIANTTDSEDAALISPIDITRPKENGIAPAECAHEELDDSRADTRQLEGRSDDRKDADNGEHDSNETEDSLPTVDREPVPEQQLNSTASATQLSRSSDGYGDASNADSTPNTSTDPSLIAEYPKLTPAPITTADPGVQGATPAPILPEDPQDIMSALNDKTGSTTTTNSEVQDALPAPASSEKSEPIDSATNETTPTIRTASDTSAATLAPTPSNDLAEVKKPEPTAEEKRLVCPQPPPTPKHIINSPPGHHPQPHPCPTVHSINPLIATPLSSPLSAQHITVPTHPISLLHTL